MEHIYTKGIYNLERLKYEIGQSAIDIAVDSLTGFGDQITVLFKAVLSSGNTTILDGIVTSHAGGSLILELQPTDVHILESVEPQPFALPVYRTKNNSTLAAQNVAINSSGAVDFLLTEELYVSGGSLIVKNAEFGDFITASVHDVDEVIPVAYRAVLCEDWPTIACYVTKNWVEANIGGITIHKLDSRPLNAKITLGLYLRITYYAINLGSTREVLMNYDLTKKL